MKDSIGYRIRLEFSKKTGAGLDLSTPVILAKSSEETHRFVYKVIDWPDHTATYPQIGELIQINAIYEYKTHSEQYKAEILRHDLKSHHTVEEIWPIESWKNEQKEEEAASAAAQKTS